VAQWLRSLVRSQLVSLEFLIDIKSFRSHYGPGEDSASIRNEYQEHFLGDKGGRCVRLTTLRPSCAVIMKSGNLNFLDPSGPLQACNGIALPFYLYISLHVSNTVVLIIRRSNCIIQNLVWSHSVDGRSMRSLRTGRPPTECDHTRCCIIQFDLLMMST